MLIVYWMGFNDASEAEQGYEIFSLGDQGALSNFLSSSGKIINSIRVQDPVTSLLKEHFTNLPTPWFQTWVIYRGDLMWFVLDNINLDAWK